MSSVDLTVAEAAELMGVTPGRIRQLIAAGQLKAIKRGRDWLIRRRTVERYQPRPTGRPATKR